MDVRMNKAPGDASEPHSAVKESGGNSCASRTTEKKRAGRLVASVLINELSKLSNVLLAAIFTCDAFFNLGCTIMTERALTRFADPDCIAIRMVETLHRPNI